MKWKRCQGLTTAAAALNCDLIDVSQEHFLYVLHLVEIGGISFSAIVSGLEDANGDVSHSGAKGEQEAEIREDSKTLKVFFNPLGISFTQSCRTNSAASPSHHTSLSRSAQRHCLIAS